MAERTVFLLSLTIILLSALLAGVLPSMQPQPESPLIIPHLQNVRDYAPAPSPGAYSYAIDGGKLFAGNGSHWQEVPLPRDVIAGAVAIDAAHPNTVYVGAANEITLYRSGDMGRNWLRVPLSLYDEGGVTDIAVDSLQRLVYVGTDTVGVYRLRDVGASLIVSGVLLLDEPVIEVVADSTGAGMAFARTRWRLYRGEHYGMVWVEVEGLHSYPTAIAIANSHPAMIYLGTTDRGVLKSQDGRVWTPVNEGLGQMPGTRLYIDALAVEPARPPVLYAATSYISGSGLLHHTPRGIAMSRDGAVHWEWLHEGMRTAAAALLPITGETGAVYALTTASRTPLLVGRAPATPTVEPRVVQEPQPSGVHLAAWAIAGCAALALIFAIGADIYSRRAVREPTAIAARPVRVK
jgi:hypothetical protein